MTALPVALCVAPNGARLTTRDHPAVPLTATELARDAAACCDAGARVLHLHVRDAKGRHTLAPEYYRAAIRRIRAATGDSLLIQVTTEAAGQYAPEEQMELVRTLMPEAASVALRELIPDRDAERRAAPFLVWAAEAQIALQYVLYSPKDVTRLVDLVKRGVVPQLAPHGLIVLGRLARDYAFDRRDLEAFLGRWPADWTWTACAFGPEEAKCVTAAVHLGGHVRVGFENNLHLPDGMLAGENAELVRDARLRIAGSPRPLATRDQAKHIYLNGDVPRVNHPSAGPPESS